MNDWIFIIFFSKKREAEKKSQLSIAANTILLLIKYNNKHWLESNYLD